MAEEEVEMDARVPMALFGLLALSGVLFIVLWGIHYGVWLDVGVYSVAVILLGFGITGAWLFFMKYKEQTKLDNVPARK